MTNNLTITTDRGRCRDSSSIIAVLILFALIVSASSANALEIRFEYVDSRSDTVIAKLSIADSLSEKLVEYIDKGVPIGFEYQVELWRVRAGWFDQQIAVYDIAYKVRYDTWAKRYTVLAITSDLVVENTLSRKREALDLILSSDKIVLSIKDRDGVYYLVGKFTAKVMTLSNFKELESWLKGEISEVEKPNIREASDKIGEFLFNTALKVTGLENISENIKTENFGLDDLPLKLDAGPE